MQIPEMPPIGMEENIYDLPDKLNKFTRELAASIESRLALFAESIERIDMLLKLQSEINIESLQIQKDLQKRSDDHYDRLDARIMSILKRLDKLEGKH